MQDPKLHKLTSMCNYIFSDDEKFIEVVLTRFAKQLNEAQLQSSHGTVTLYHMHYNLRHHTLIIEKI